MHSVKPGEMDLCECIVNMWSLCSISEIDLGNCIILYAVIKLIFHL
jgi:hypothetical protein